MGEKSKKERTYVYVWADSLHYAVEANITLQSKCTPIKIKFLKIYVYYEIFQKPLNRNNKTNSYLATTYYKISKILCFPKLYSSSVYFSLPSLKVTTI